MTVTKEIWRPIAEADNGIAYVHELADLRIGNSYPVWARDEDGRIFEAVWSDNGKKAYWWDLEGESPVDPVEFMPHPLDPRFSASLSSRSAEAGKPAVTQEMIDRLVDAEVDDVLSNSDGGAPSIEKQKLLTREIDDARKAIEAALSTPADSEPVAWLFRNNGDDAWLAAMDEPEICYEKRPLYAAPVAVREPVSVPEGWTQKRKAVIERDGSEITDMGNGSWRLAAAGRRTYQWFTSLDDAIVAAPQPNPSKVDADDLPQSPWPASEWAIETIDRLTKALERIINHAEKIDIGQSQEPDHWAHRFASRIEAQEIKREARAALAAQGEKP